MKAIVSSVAVLALMAGGAFVLHQGMPRLFEPASAQDAQAAAGGPAGLTLCPPVPTHMPLIGEAAPSFEATTTQGPIRFPEDFQGAWVILFSHPSDFTPVCTTEFMTFASAQPQFEALGCELVGLSVDSVYSHIAWLRTIEEKIEFRGMKNVRIDFPVIADLRMDVAKKYGMIHPESNDCHAVRAVFVIDPEAKIRAILYYPSSTGRNFDELLRLLVALQTADAHRVATPADWVPGRDVIVPPPRTMQEATRRVLHSDPAVDCVDWFFCLQKLPKAELNLPPDWQRPERDADASPEPTR